MENLIKALQIFLKYRPNEDYIECEHDIFMIFDITESEITEEDTLELNKLGFKYSKSYDAWAKYF